ncbi:hypothetical protein LguiA_007443 [Lonicera macranthoides]
MKHSFLECINARVINLLYKGFAFRVLGLFGNIVFEENLRLKEYVVATVISCCSNRLK